MIGPPRDYHLVEGLNIEVVEDYSKGVDIIINTGPRGDNDILENYTDLLKTLIKYCRYFQLNSLLIFMIKYYYVLRYNIQSYIFRN